jgi:hypothetical protein
MEAAIAYFDAEITLQLIRLTPADRKTQQISYRISPRSELSGELILNCEPASAALVNFW